MSGGGETCTSCNTFGDKEAANCLRAFPSGRKYNVVYVDPPWRYESDGNMTHKPYPTMAFADIAALPVPSISAPDCACFMWTSNPMLDKAIELLAAWGFTYKTVFKVWTKRSTTGLPARVPGYWSMSSVELLLVGSRGAMQKYKTASDEPQEHASRRGAHSEKPPEIRDCIRRLLDVPARVEIFARHLCDGWDAWGLDVPGYVRQEGLSVAPRRGEMVRAFLRCEGDGVRLALRVVECSARAAQTRVMTMRKPTFDLAMKQPANRLGKKKGADTPPPAAPPPAPPPAAEDDEDKRKDRDRVPVIKGDVVVRGPARPSRLNFEKWWNSAHKGSGVPNSAVYRVPDDFLAANPDIARSVARGPRK